MYKSPIEVIRDEITCNVVKQEHEMIVRAVQRVVPMITEEELIKALQYDRGQYEQGFRDGRKARDAEIVRCHECEYWKEIEGVEGLMFCTYTTGATIAREADDFCSRGDGGE